MAALRALAIPGTTIASVWLLGEALSLRQWLGIGVLVAGIWFLRAPA